MTTPTKIDKIRELRHCLLGHVKDLPAEQLNTIPKGFSNNIVWQLGHLVSSLQRICYFRSGLPMVVDKKYIDPFASGTKPGGFISEEEIAVIKTLLISSVEQLKDDYGQGHFKTYLASDMVKKVYGISIENIEDALEFMLYHEGLHTGQILAIKRCLQDYR